MKHIIYIPLFIISLLPLQLLYYLSSIIKLINSYFIKYRIQILEKNIRLSFPRYSRLEQKKIILQFYNNFFNLIIEIIKSITFNKKNITNRVKIHNVKLLEKNIKQNKSTILVCGHYANWEWLLLRLSLINNIKLAAIYKPLSNNYLNNVLFKIRTKFGAKLIPVNKYGAFLLNKKNQSHTLMFVSDQVPKEKNHGKRIEFLNQSTLFHEGAEKTSRLIKSDVFYVEMIKNKKGYYSVYIKPIKSKKVTYTYAKLLEKNIKQNPANWLWSHNRWKR